MNKQGVNTFSKGMHKDSSVLNQPEGTYIDALNITLLNNRGEYHSMCNEKGTAEHVAIPDNYNVIGHTVVDNTIIAFLVDSVNSYSQIGIIKEGNYIKKVPSSGEDNELNFNINNPIDAVGKKLFNGDVSVYFTDNTNPIAVLNLDDLPENIERSKSIIPEINLATITINEVIEGGNLKAGVVQFMVRYLNKELVPTITTPPTNPTPILGSKEGESDISEVYGGDYEQWVNKAVSLTIDDIDTDYPYFELIAVNYEGATSAPKVIIVGTYNITSTSVDVVYAGELEDSIAITLDEVIVDPVTYDKAKAVEQKDGRLFFSNLTESKSRYRDELQDVANNIDVFYNADIKPRNFYADPVISTEKKTYRRGEVYSFGLGVIFKDGSTSYVYHIPGADALVNTPGRYQAYGITGGRLGSYLSEDAYPTNQGYPTDYGDGSTKIRHHLMPTIAQQPTFQSDVAGSVANSISTSTATSTTADDDIVVLNLDFTFVKAIPQDIQDEIQEIILYREPRSSPEKRSQLAQGFASNIYMGGYKYQENGKDSDADKSIRGGDVIEGSYHFKKNIGFFNCQLNTRFEMNDYNAGAECKSRNPNGGRRYQLSTHHGFYYSVKTLDETIEATVGDTNGMDYDTEEKYQKLDWQMSADKFCFSSPETLLGDGVFLSTNASQGATLLKKAELWCPYSDPNRLSQGIYDNDAEFESQNTKQFISKAGNFNNHYNVQGFISFYNSSDYRIAATVKNAAYINNGDDKYLAGLERYYFDNDWSNKFMYLRLDDYIEQSDNTIGNILDTDFGLDQGGYDNTDTFLNVGEKTVDAGIQGSTNNNVDMFAVENELSNQYGRVESSQYTPIVRSKNVSKVQFNSVYSGDTFITEYSIVNKNLFRRFFPYGKSKSNNISYYQGVFGYADEGANDNDSRIITKPTIMKNSYSSSVIKGSVYGAVVTYPVESDINCYFRHRENNDVPYFPESDIETVLSAIPNQEDNRSYNTQYSIDNVLKTTYVTRPIFDEAITSYPNRTIYSERSNEDSKVDDYQVFKQNSFYDLPEETGEIIDTFVWNNELYSHTPKALWRNFVNTVTREANSIGDVVLGTGGLFKLPSQKVITSDGGYGGTVSQFGNAITPFGYFFVDSLQRKVFKLTDNLEEISLKGMQQFFDENTKVYTDFRANPLDNTFRTNSPRGIAMGWDNEYKKVMITQHGAEGETFTVSYGALTGAWVSFHSYAPNTYIEYDKFLHVIQNNEALTAKFHTLNQGNYGVFFDEAIAPARIEISSNSSPGMEKVFDNFNIHCRSYEDNGDFTSEDTFSSIDCKNDYQDSGELNLLNTNDFNPTIGNDEILTRWKKSHFQLYVPRDNHRFNLDNPDDWKLASRLKSKYLKTTFTYNNLNNREFIVNFIEYIYRIIAR